jgi:TPR repeat protein
MIRWISFSLAFVIFVFPLLAENQGQDAGTLYLEARKLAMGEGCQIDMIRARELYRKAADLGDPRALAWKARCIFLGVRGFSKNEVEARKILQEIEPRLREMGLNKQGDALESLCRTLATMGPKTRGQEAFELAQKNAINGKASDWEALGWFFQGGIGVAKDEKEAVKWYRKAAEQGEATGQRLLGWCYANGTGVAKDEKEAVKWYRKAAEQGEATGQRLLGWCYANGTGVAKDEKEAVKWYRKAAEQGEATGQRLLGWCYANGAGVAKDDKESVNWYGKAAEKGDGWSQNKLGYCYACGIGVEKDYKKAFEWYRKAAEQGDRSATGNVGWCYETGNGVAKDEKEAVKWYGKAAEKGDAWSQNKLAFCYACGIGVEKDYKKAFEWYRKAAEQGVGSATGNVGWCYETGNGVAKDEKEAVKWYGKAAEKGDGWSQNKLAFCYANGIGLEKDYKKALEWYRKAADKENGDAIGNVGWCYETGNGVAKDENEALKWYVQAAKKKNSWAEKRLMTMGDAAYLDKNYSLAAKCFEAAEKFGIKGAGDGLYRLDVQSRKMWDGADPKRGILAKRRAVKGEENVNSETARLAGELLSFGYPIEAKKMVQEAIENARWGTPDKELAGWYTLAGFCCLADPQVLPERLISETPTWWPKWLRPEFAQVGLGMLNLKVGSTQLGLDVSYFSDFISPSEPRRWASLLMAQFEWALKLWQEQSTGWFPRLARASVASTSKGVDYLWATQNLKNPSEAKESFEKATKLFPNFSAWAGLAMIARQEGDDLGQEKAVEEMKNILIENEKRDATHVSKTAKSKTGKKKPEDLEKARDIKRKARLDKMFEGMTKAGKLPWGHEKGEISFGFGYGGGPALFHGGLLACGAKLLIPILLYVKPDWLMLAYDMYMKSGSLSAYQLAPLYEQLAERPSTRKTAISRLVQVHRYLEDKEETLRWALCAAEESPHDIQTLKTAAWVAQWAGKREEARIFTNQLIQEEKRIRLSPEVLSQETYSSIVEKISEADLLAASGDDEEAKHLYRHALSEAKRFEKTDDEAQMEKIQNKIKYLEKKIGEIDQVGGGK